MTTVENGAHFVNGERTSKRLARRRLLWSKEAYFAGAGRAGAGQRLCALRAQLDPLASGLGEL